MIQQSHSWAYMWKKKDPCTPVVVESLFTTAKTWKQSK